MSDEQLRALRRRWEQTRRVEDEAALLVERVRVGDLTSVWLRAAAHAGAPAAVLAYPQRTVEDFIELLDVIPWFANVGRPHQSDATVRRVRDWADWRGPERENDERAGTPHDWHAFDERLDDALFERARDIARERGGAAIPGYDPDEDAYDPRMAASQTAGFWAGVIVCHVHEGRLRPAECIPEWLWLVDGHWPCGYDRAAGELVVL